MSNFLGFRLAEGGDVEALLSLVESAYRGDASRAGWTTEADLLEGQRTDRAELSALLDDPGASIVLCLEGSALVGSVLVKHEAEGLAHIGMFAVRPTLQGRGLGGKLLAEAERLASARYAARVARMTVIEQRLELLAWYARRGYRDTGKTEPFPYGNPRFGLPLRDDLRFVVLEKRISGC